MLSFYQNFPSCLDPIAFKIGIFSIRWYSLMYIFGCLIFILLLNYRLVKKEYRDKKINRDLILNYLIWSFLGLLIGGRLGHIIVYNFSYYIKHPLEIISPLDNFGNYIGIFGMSYFGGLIGVIVFSWFFLKKNRINLWHFSDFIIPAIPAGYFWGRIGNFLNGELYGKETQAPWGMYFFSDKKLRHPTQLYEAFLEGIILFAILWFFRNNKKWKGNFLSIYLFGYGTMRFFVEFFRQSNEKNLFYFNISQWLSILMIILGIFILKKKKNIV